MTEYPRNKVSGRPGRPVCRRLGTPIWPAPRRINRRLRNWQPVGTLIRQKKPPPWASTPCQPTIDSGGARHEGLFHSIQVSNTPVLTTPWSEFTLFARICMCSWRWGWSGVTAAPKPERGATLNPAFCAGLSIHVGRARAAVTQSASDAHARIPGCQNTPRLDREHENASRMSKNRPICRVTRARRNTIDGPNFVLRDGALARDNLSVSLTT